MGQHAARPDSTISYVLVFAPPLPPQAEALRGFLDEDDSSVGLSVEKKASVIPRVRT